MLVSYDMALLVVVAFREARGDGRDAMRAVAHVVGNRVKANKSSWVTEICKPKQFSSMTICGDSQTVVWPSEADTVNLYTLMHQVYDEPILTTPGVRCFTPMNPMSALVGIDLI